MAVEIEREGGLFKEVLELEGPPWSTGALEVKASALTEATKELWARLRREESNRSSLELRLQALEHRCDEVHAFASAGSSSGSDHRHNIEGNSSAEDFRLLQSSVQLLDLELSKQRRIQDQRARTATELLEFRFDAMQRHLEGRYQAIEDIEAERENRLGEALLRRVRETAVEEASRVVRTALAGEAEGLHQRIERVAHSLEDRLCDFEERLAAMNFPQPKVEATVAAPALDSNADAGAAAAAGALHAAQASAVASKAAEMATASLAEQVSQLSKSVSAVSADLSTLATNWGQGRFESQEALSTWLEKTFEEHISSMRVSDESIRTELHNKVDTLEGHFRHRFTNIDRYMNPAMLAKWDELDSKMEGLGVYAAEARQFKESVQAEIVELHRQQDHFQSVEARFQHFQDHLGAHISQLFNDFAKDLVREQVSGLLHSGGIPELDVLLRETEEKTKRGVDDDEVHQAMSPQMVLFEGLEARITQLERNDRNNRIDRSNSSPPRPPVRPASSGPRRSTGGTVSNAVDGTHLAVLREELQRLKGRVGKVEETVEQSSAILEEEKKHTQNLLDIRRDFQEQVENNRRELDNLTRALRGSQRGEELTVARLEDLASLVSKLQSKVEAGLPPLLRAIGHLARTGGGGTGDTYTDGGAGGGEDSLAALQGLLFGSDGSGSWFLTQTAFKEALGAFEDNLQEQLMMLRQAIATSLQTKADSGELRSLSSQLEALGQNFQLLSYRVFETRGSSKVQSEMSAENAAIFRLPLQGRCVSCDRKVDVAVDRGGNWDKPNANPLVSSSPRERVPSAHYQRRRNDTSLPAIDREIAVA
jgi:chromosome segregation ATPase